MPAAGYSGTPLAKKLGIKAGTRLLPLHAPDEYATLLAPLPPARQLTALRRALRTDAAVWVSWPKKAAKIETDVTEDTIREVALPLGFVDVKVCAVSDVWSGLKLVVRRQLR